MPCRATPIREIKLASPTLDEAIAPAQQVLTEYGGSVDAAKAIAQATRDCPLATVMAAQIVATEGQHFELAKNDDSFRSTLFGKFQDVIAGDIGEKAARKSQSGDLLCVLVLCSPFIRTIRSLPGRSNLWRVSRYPRSIASCELLCDGGVLFRRGGQYRLSPDLLADFIIEKACVGQAGQSTGYAEQVFDNIGGPHMQRMLLNLGKLDWRLRNSGDPSTSPFVWTAFVAPPKATPGRFRESGRRGRLLSTGRCLGLCGRDHGGRLLPNRASRTSSNTQAIAWRTLRAPLISCGN